MTLGPSSRIPSAWIEWYDPRLRDEALDWCIRNSHLVSVVRLRNILRENATNSLTPGVFNVRAGVKWPRAGDPLNYKITGRSTLRPLTEPPMTYLRSDRFSELLHGRRSCGACSTTSSSTASLFRCSRTRPTTESASSPSLLNRSPTLAILRQRLHKQSECVRACESEKLQRFIGAQPMRAGMERPAAHSRNVARDFGSLGRILRRGPTRRDSTCAPPD
jgi:hypothetical protein